VCSPLLIGVMLTLSWPPDRILLVMAVAPLLAGLMIAVLSWSLKPDKREAGLSYCSTTKQLLEVSDAAESNWQAVTPRMRRRN
jgi:hypothetical protein